MSNQTQPKTIADLDALQKSLNPAHLDRLPRPHNLLAADVADNLASEIGDLADDLEAQANLWRVADLTAADAPDASLLATRAYDAAWLELCRLPLETLALACAYSAGSYPGVRRIMRDCAVRHAVRAMVEAATSGRLADRCDMMVWHGRPIQD